MRIEIEIGFSFKRDIEEGFRFLELPDGTDVLGALNQHINALVNGGNVVHRSGFRTVLNDGDRLTILPPVGGG